MCVTHRHGQVGVAHEFLDCDEIDATKHEVGGERVTEVMEPTAADAGVFNGA